MRFDWYQATISDEPGAILDALRKGYGSGVEVVEGRGLHGYRQRFDVKGGGIVLASVLAGGKNGNPNAWASGPETDAFQAIVREHWGGLRQHKVTRADAAEDFDQEGGYEALRRVLRRILKDRGVKGREIVPEDLEDGRTFYAGAASSAVRLRLYEKGKQQRSVVPEPEKVSRDWVRMEVQVRPAKESGYAAAMLSPSELWGFSDWTTEAARLALELDIPRVEVKPWRESDDDRAWRFMLKQYRKVLWRRLDLHGSPAALGAQIVSDLEAIERDEAFR